MLEILPFILISLLFFLLALRNFKVAFLVLLALSIFLHKELFQIYRWDMMPIRAAMLGLLGYGLFEVLLLFKQTKNLKKFWSLVSGFLKNPFILTLALLWLSRLVSLYFSKNLQSSIFLLGFFTTAVALGFVLYSYFFRRKSPQPVSSQILDFIKAYIYIVLAACLFGYFQIYLYTQYDKIIGALWNVPGHLPRVGSTFWDVNHFGALLAALLPVLGIFIITAPKIRQKIFYLLTFLPIAGILLLTSSRTAWMVAFFALLTFITLFLIRKFKSKGVLIILAAIVLVTTPLAIEYSRKPSPFRALIKNYFHYRMDSFDSHLLLLRGAVEIFEEYPILGGGYGSFFEHFSRTEVAAELFGRDPAALNTRVPAHTIWGELASETGVVGLFIFILFVAVGLLPLLHTALNSKDKSVFLTSAAMFSALVGWLLAGIFYSYNAEFFWLVLFLYFFYGFSVCGVSDLKKTLGEKLEEILGYFSQKTSIGAYLVLLVALIIIFAGLGRTHLIPWDEAIYAKIAKNMVETKEFISMRWQPGVPWYEKPPLFMWLMAASMSVFGANSWGARIPSALFGFLTVVLTYFMGKKMFGKTAGLISALVLATTTQYIYYARASMLDVTTTFFIATSLYFYFKAQTGKAYHWIVAGVFCGLAVMTKGIVGFLPLPVMGLYELYKLLVKGKKLSTAEFKNYFLVLGPCVLIFAPWHLEMYRRFGMTFIDNYLGYHVITRATVEIEDKGRHDFWWYLEVLKVSMRIWFIALLAAFPFSILVVVKPVREFIEKRFKFLGKSVQNFRISHAETDSLVFLLIWIVFVFFFFTVAKSKLVWYIIPLYPVLAVLVGFFVAKVINVSLEVLPGFKSISTKAVLRGLLVFILVTFGLLYFFKIRHLVYTHDFTEDEATLLQLKDEEFGTEAHFYIDKVELPLILFYSDSPFTQVQYRDLIFIFSNKSFVGELTNICFLTKESRFKTIKALFPEADDLAGTKDWTLGCFKD